MDTLHAITTVEPVHRWQAHSLHDERTSKSSSPASLNFSRPFAPPNPAIAQSSSPLEEPLSRNASLESSNTFSDVESQHGVIYSEEYPDEQALAQAGEVPIYDSEGKETLFKTLYSGDSAMGEQQLVIFVRHFFCGVCSPNLSLHMRVHTNADITQACQTYVKALHESITLRTYFSLATPSSITLIGLGSPLMIPSYRRLTETPFPIYADPSRRLYKALGMSWTLNWGRRGEYMKGINEYQWMKGQFQQLREEENRLRLKGGNILWIGGEFLFRGGEVVWCRRMKNYRDHSDIKVIRRLLGLDG